MDLKTLSLDPIRSRKVAVIGYGNQGRAHALNLRDSGVQVVVGSRPGAGWSQALVDDFVPVSPREAAEWADVVMLTLPDQVISEVYGPLADVFRKGKIIGFAHGFAYHYALIERFPECSYFIVAPKGAGAILRENFTKGGGLPGVFAVDDPKISDLVKSYAKAIGCADQILIESSFQEEVECDLFGEQAVLCGGIFELMEQAYEVLVENGHSEEMAFFECCFEARMILELWMKFGPRAVRERISPTAYFGGLTRGKRLVTAETRREMERMFQEIRRGDFAKEWMGEVGKGMPQLKQETERAGHSSLQGAHARFQKDSGLN